MSAVYYARKSFVKAVGFTLVELLTAIGIIGLLTVLIITSTNKVSANTKAAKCASNLRQIGIALDLYANEHNECYPRTINKPEEGTTGTTWMQKLIPYVGLPEGVMGPSPAPRAVGIFVCPTFRPSNPRFVSYAYNWNVSATASLWFFRRNVVPQPSHTILVVEIDGMNNDQFTASADGDLARRHLSNNSNILFVDGHVEAINYEIPISSNDPLWRWW